MCMREEWPIPSLVDHNAKRRNEGAGEVDQRRLYARQASSMFVYCTETLHLSGAEAFLRIAVARAARKHPVLLSMLEDGRLHLSGIAKLAPVLTEANRDALLARAEHKTKRKIEELVAEVAPKPDVADAMRKLPERREPSKPAPAVEQRPDAVASLPVYWLGKLGASDERRVVELVEPGIFTVAVG